MSDIPHLRPPPREVPPGAWLCALLPSGVLALIGWVFMGGGLIFPLALGAPRANLEDLRLSSSGVRVEGALDGIRQTGSSVNDEWVLELSYHYTLSDAPYTGRSYATWSPAAIGEPVALEVLPSAPEISRVAETRRSSMPIWVTLFACLFPLIGAGIIASMLPAGHRRARLMREGMLEMARFVKMEQTNIEINDQPLMELSFTFEDDRGEPRVATLRVVNPRPYTSGRAQPVLYHPRERGLAVLLAEAPGVMEIDDTGRWRSAGLGDLIGALWGPALVAAVLTVGLGLRLGPP